MKGNEGHGTRYVNPFRVQESKPPLSWRLLERIREKAESKIQWCVGKGFVDFWYDRWLFDVPLVDLVSLVNPLTCCWRSSIMEMGGRLIG